MDRLLKITEAAKIFGVDRSALYRWQKKGIIKFIKVGNTNKIKESEVKRILGEK